jgi:hypothetical protein
MAGIQEIKCACGKAFIWASEEGIEEQCHGCHRKVIVPYRNLRGLQHPVRFVEQWRKEERE